MHRYLLELEVQFICCSLKCTSQPGALLDLCCGSGEISLTLHEQGLRTIGLDANRLALDKFREGSPDVPLVHGDALRLPFSNSSLGYIVSIHCFDHLDRIGFLHECCRVLRRGGLLLFDFVNRHSYKLVLKRIHRWTSLALDGRLSDKWLDVFSYKEALQAIAKAGFDIQTVYGYGWIPFTVNSESRLVHAAAWIEQVLRFDLFPSISPRVLVAARKQSD